MWRVVIVFAGLILELYIQQNEYLPILSDTAGIRLIIHNHTYMPLPEKEGIVLSPGVATNIAITKASAHNFNNSYLILHSRYFKYVYGAECNCI